MSLESQFSFLFQKFNLNCLSVFLLHNKLKVMQSLQINTMLNGSKTTMRYRYARFTFLINVQIKNKTLILFFQIRAGRPSASYYRSQASGTIIGYYFSIHVEICVCSLSHPNNSKNSWEHTPVIASPTQCRICGVMNLRFAGSCANKLYFVKCGTAKELIARFVRDQACLTLCNSPISSYQVGKYERSYLVGWWILRAQQATINQLHGV